jgi:hypothetical protein
MKIMGIEKYKINEQNITKMLNKKLSLCVNRLFVDVMADQI